MKYFIAKLPTESEPRYLLTSEISQHIYDYVMSTGEIGEGYCVLACPNDEAEPSTWYYDGATQTFHFRIEVFQARNWEAIKTVRDRKLKEGFYSQSHWFASDNASKINILLYQGMLFNRKLNSLPTDVNIQIDNRDVTIKTLENGEITLTYDGLETLINDLNLFTAKINNHALDKKVSMMLLADPRVYDAESGFIPTFASLGVQEPTSLVSPPDEVLS